MKNVILLFFTFFAFACTPDEITPVFKINEDVDMQLGIKELIETRSTDRFETLSFSFDAHESNGRSTNPIKFSLSYLGNEELPPPDCCGVEFIGFGQHDNINEPFIVLVQEQGIEENYSDEWIHWDIDEVDSFGNFIRDENDFYGVSYGQDFDAPCNTNEQYGVGLFWPVGTISTGLYRFTVEKGYTQEGELIVCSTDIGYAEYGCTVIIECE